jgi:predicted O-methyltransferase YrrM
MNIKLSNDLLDNFNMKNFEYLVTPTYYNLKSGEQEYKLYSYLTTFFNNTVILDIGTSHGTSAVALSHNCSNKIISYDIIDCIRNSNHLIYTKQNIEFRIKNILEDLNTEFLNNIKIIMIDIDHYGEMEKKIIERLNELKFSGIIILDDVFNHPDNYIKESMKKLWDNITQKKIDVTKYGHWSGTGLILMNTDINIILE